MHDSFGIIEKIWTYVPSEDTSYGQGDLHLPLGWGDIPFEKIFTEIKFPSNINLNFELPKKLTIEENLNVYGRLYGVKNLKNKDGKENTYQS